VLAGSGFSVSVVGMAQFLLFVADGIEDDDETWRGQGE
jgi:hypothetical protein